MKFIRGSGWEQPLANSTAHMTTSSGACPINTNYFTALQWAMVGGTDCTVAGRNKNERLSILFWWPLRAVTLSRKAK